MTDPHIEAPALPAANNRSTVVQDVEDLLARIEESIGEIEFAANAINDAADELADLDLSTEAMWLADDLHCENLTDDLDRRVKRLRDALAADPEDGDPDIADGAPEDGNPDLANAD